MLNKEYKYCLAGVSWNVDNDSVLLQLTDQDHERVRVRFTPEEAIEIANKLQAVAQMLIIEISKQKNEK